MSTHEIGSTRFANDLAEADRDLSPTGVIAVGGSGAREIAYACATGKPLTLDHPA